jgi:uncharacterized protein GlcG (DUF336 family)
MRRTFSATLVIFVAYTLGAAGTIATANPNHSLATITGIVRDSKGNPLAGALRLTNIVPAQGALPIKVGNETIGAVGVSGAPGGDKDEACAKAGIEKVTADLK